MMSISKKESACLSSLMGRRLPKEARLLGITKYNRVEWNALKRKLRQEILEACKDQYTLKKMFEENPKITSSKRNNKAKHIILYDLSDSECVDSIRVLADSVKLDKAQYVWINTMRQKLVNEANQYEFMVKNYLINAGVEFIHQKPIYISKHIYFLDFYLPHYKMAIEVDGEYHTATSFQQNMDSIRTKHIEKMNINVVRITNEEVANKQFQIIQSMIKTVSKIDETQCSKHLKTQ